MTATETCDPILTSKITAPGVPGWAVPRPRLDKLLAEGALGLVTTVTGPPGAGKTMALALWAATGGGGNSIAWVTVDDFDNRPGVFWSYVLAALREAGVPVPRGLFTAARRYPIDHDFLLQFASVMADREPRVTLILDDVHLLTAAEVPAGLAYVLKHAGSGLHVVMSSRMDPLLPLHRYRLAGELTEIRASDLAFTVPESRLLLDQHGVTLSDEWLARLTQRAEGWAAVMRMAAITMGGHSDPERFAGELVAEDAAVTGYLVDEVLAAQPAHVRDFLLKTSILDKVAEDVAAEVSGNERGAAILVDLARANPLIQRDDSGWYHYHSLFAAVLRLKLRREDPDRVADLHGRAARWYSRTGLLTEAVRHAASAGDWDLACRAVIDDLAVSRLLEPGGNEPLATGFRELPAERDWAKPQPLLVAAALHLASGQEDAGAAVLGDAEAMLGKLPGHDIPAELAAAQCRLTLSRRTGDFEAALVAASRAQALIEAMGEDQLARRPQIRAHVLTGSGTALLWSGDLAAATAAFEAAASAARACGSEDEQADCLGYLALVEALSGGLSGAAELAAEATAGPDDGSQPASPASRAAEVALALIHLERYELPQARLWLTQAQDGLRVRTDKVLGPLAWYVAGRECLADGRGQAALEMVGRAEDGWSPPSWLERRLLVLRSCAKTTIADYQSAIDAARRAGAGTSADATAALARAFLAAGDPQAARTALKSMAPDEHAPDHLSLWLADAQVSYAGGSRAAGRRSLEHALALAEPQELRLPLVLDRRWLRAVLRDDAEIAHRYRRLLEPGVLSPGRAQVVPQAGPPDADQPAPLIVEPLSEREREVLQYVSAMESNAEIATKLYISVNTVKTHLKSIYRKLATTRRGEAVRRARQLGIL
jgi:LuxR family maltose regulon positive regulatory protein